MDQAAAFLRPGTHRPILKVTATSTGAELARHCDLRFEQVE